MSKKNKEKNGIPVIKKLLALKVAEVRGYFTRMLGVDQMSAMKAFDERISKYGNKRSPDVKDDVAIIPIRGQIFQYDDMWCWWFEGAATENIEAQIDAALENDSIKGIVLDINSPGGEGAGIHDLANKIAEGKNKKPIIAYVSDQAASAAYWLASAADTIIASKTAQVGCIGAILAFFDDDDKRTIDFVSSISPDKNPDPKDTEGAMQIQKWVDDFGNIFVEQVALLRGVSFESVANDFGKGDVLNASEALNVKMIDKIGNFKLALELAKGINIDNKKSSGFLSANNKIGVQQMSNKIFARINSGKKQATLVIVDDDAEGVVVPDDAIPVSEIDVAWLEQNLPELVEEIKEIGRQEEMERQGSVDEMDVDDTEEVQAILKAAKKDTKADPKDVALKIVKTGGTKKTSSPGNTADDDAASHVDAQAGNGDGQLSNEQKEYRVGAKKAAAARKKSRGIK